MIDLHIHSYFSPDSASGIDDIIEKAKSIGLKVIGISDHYDLEERIPFAYRINDIEVYLETLEFYSNIEGIRLLKGLEVGIQSTTSEFEDKRFDYLIYSVHGMPGVEDLSDKIQVIDYEKFYRDYFEEMLASLDKVNQPGFLGHMDYPRRYIEGNPRVPESLYGKVREIFQLLKEKDIGIEINTSNLDREFFDMLPSFELVREYVNITDGKLITIGSDAHTVDRVGKFSKKVIEMLKDLGVKTVYYCQKGKYVEIEI